MTSPSADEACPMLQGPEYPLPVGSSPFVQYAPLPLLGYGLHNTAFYVYPSYLGGRFYIAGVLHFTAGADPGRARRRE
jgi:hypothetical protein